MKVDRLFAPVDIAMLVYFRIAFGITALCWVCTTVFAGKIHAMFVMPRVHFTYPGLAWIRPIPVEYVHSAFYLLGACAACIAIGMCYRLSAALFAVGFTYLFLVDKTLYQNHYYLICLISWLMVVVPAHRAFSIDSIVWPRIRTAIVPRWSLWLIRFQIAVPYIYGGIAKLNGDWLRGQPMQTMLQARAADPLFGTLLAHPSSVWLFSYGGLLFDLLIVPALLYRKTRSVGFAVAVAFHVTNAALFPIGIFPWFMILATVVFFPPDLPRRLARSFRAANTPVVPPQDESQPGVALGTLVGRQKVVVALLGAYIAVQLLVPLRHFAYAGNPSWTERGHYFAWHMLLRGKKCAIRFHATDPVTRESGTIDLRRYVTAYQVTRFCRDPDMIHQLCQFIAEDLRQYGRQDVQIHVLAIVSFNGRKPQLMIDPTVDLATEPRWLLANPPWLLPLEEPLRNPGWVEPLTEWERQVEIPAAMSQYK